jgi:hypothetical protein
MIPDIDYLIYNYRPEPEMDKFWEDLLLMVLVNKDLDLKRTELVGKDTFQEYPSQL